MMTQGSLLGKGNEMEEYFRRITGDETRNPWTEK